MENKLKVNPGKSGIVLFSRRKTRCEPMLGTFKLFNVTVDLKAVVKYLGILFDHRLTWIPHVEEKLNKCIGIFWLCRNAFGRKWGLSPKAIWWIYTAVVRPTLCHGCVVWWPKTEAQTTMKRLNKLQRLACLCITGVKNSTATMALEALLSIPPLDLYIKSTAFNAALNMQFNGRWYQSSGKSHTTILNQIKDDRLLMISDQMSAVYMLEDAFEWAIPEREEWQGTDSTLPPPVSIVCFTDGSKKEGLSGAGYYCESLGLGKSISTGGLASVFQTELFAITSLCKEGLIDQTQGEDIVICTDSQSAIEAVSGPVVKSKTVYECKKTLIVLSQSNRVPGFRATRVTRRLISWPGSGQTMTSLDQNLGSVYRSRQGRTL